MDEEKCDGQSALQRGIKLPAIEALALGCEWRTVQNGILNNGAAKQLLEFGDDCRALLENQ